MMGSLYEIDLQTIDGQPAKLGDYAGKVLLIVNVASKCGFTKQYTGLEALYRRFKDRGLVVLGFPCDQFGHQEPGSEAEIKAFCSLTYDVTFPLFAKIEDMVGQDPSGMGIHHQGAVGHQDGFVNVVCDQQEGDA